MGAAVIDGKVVNPRGCELSVAHHCNLACRSCSHLSPVFKKQLVDPEIVFRDFSILGKYYRPSLVKLLGGEPLLHPALCDVIDAVRSSAICDWIQVWTNGLRLPRTSDAFWRRVDEIHVSVYPGAELPNHDVAAVTAKAEEFGVKLSFNRYYTFRESHSEIGTDDDSLIRRIYSACLFAHVWQCHAVDDGFFFKCPQSIAIPRVLRGATGSPNGIQIEDCPEFRDRLVTYLEDPEPLPACRNCLGNAGRLFPHEQQGRRDWRAPQQRRTEDLLNQDFLEELERDPETCDVTFGRAHRLQKLV